MTVTDPGRFAKNIQLISNPKRSEKESKLKIYIGIALDLPKITSPRFL